MAIERHLIMDSEGAKPIINRVVAQGNRVHVCGITGDPVGDVTARTRQALGRIDDRLARAGTDKGMTGWTPSIRRCGPASRQSDSPRDCSSRSW
jgi:enamine deaminase RidA (YjgF/YER057c/UK114 family)